MSSYKDTDEWITTAEAAHILGVSVITVQRRVKSDREFPRPVVRTRKTVRFCRREVEEYAKTCLEENNNQLE